MSQHSTIEEIRRSACFTPELQLLSALSSTAMLPEMTSEARSLIESGISWDRFIDEASCHKLVNLAHSNLKAHFKNDIPAYVLQALFEQVHNLACKDIGLCRELIDIANILETNNIPFVAFKGAVFAAQVYGSLACRPFGDIDIIIRKSDVDKAYGLFTNAGFATVADDSGEDPRPFVNDQHFLESSSVQKVVSLVRPGRCILELHWAFTPTRLDAPLNFESLAKCNETVNVLGKPFRALTPEDLVLTMCLHGTKHYWDRLSYYVDLAEIFCRYPGIDWNIVANKARALGLRRIVDVAVLLSTAIFASKLPDEVLVRAEGDAEAVRLAKSVMQLMVERRIKQRNAYSNYDFTFRIRERLADRIKYVAYLVTTPTAEDWQAMPMRSEWARAYYVIRPVRLAFSAVRSLFRPKHRGKQPAPRQIAE